MFSVSRTCGSCGGAGAFADDTENKKLEVKIPAGVDNGTRLRMTGEGDAGINNGPSGDLYIDITVKEHPFFKERMRIYFVKFLLVFQMRCWEEVLKYLL